MNDPGLDPSCEPSVEPKKPGHEESMAPERTVVGGVAALAVVSLFLLLSLLVTVWLDRRGLAAVAALATAPLYLVAYRIFSRWERSWEWIAFLARYFPPLAGLLAEKRRRQAIGCLVERIECVVGFYRLEGLFAAGQIVSRRGIPRFSDRLKATLIDSIPVEVGPDIWPDELIAGLARENRGWQPGTRKVLDLLYQERLGQCDSIVWQQFRQDDEDDQALHFLAGALAASETLHDPEETWSADDLAAVLREMPRFSRDLLRDRLHELADLAGKAAAYLGFLKENGVALRDDRPAVDELKKILAQAQAWRFGKPETRRDAALLIRVGRTAIGEALARKAETAQAEPPRSDELREDAQDPLLRRYALLAAILYLTRISPRDPARERLCLDLAAEPQDEGVRLAWAYLELKQDFRSEQRLPGRPFLSFADLVEGWRSQLDRAAQEPYLRDEIGELRVILQEGSWVNRLSDLLDRAQSDRLKQLLPPSPTVLKKDDAARQVVKRYRLDHRPELLGNLVRQADLETLARNLEAGLIPYLITFRADRGPLSRLIDCLTIPKKLGKAGVATKYDFRRYTENARIGLVPEGLSFEQFRERFQEDFSKVVAARRNLINYDWEIDLEGIEVMLHRFSAVSRCAFESELSRRVALSNLKDLLAENLPPEKLVALVQSSTTVSLKDYVLSASIPDVVGDEASLSGVEAQLLANQDGQIKNELLAELHAKDIQQLARRLSRQNIDHAEAAETLAKLLERYVPQFNAVRSSRIANVYLHGLESLAAA